MNDLYHQYAFLHAPIGELRQALYFSYTTAAKLL
jgi:hypothetical protein